MPKQSKRIVPTHVSGKGQRERDDPLPGVSGTRPPSPPKLCEESDAEGSSGTEEGDSVSGDSVLSQGCSDSETDGIDGLGVRDLYIRLARTDGIAKYHYDQYRKKNAQRNIIKRTIQNKQKRRKTDSTQKSD